MLYRFRASDRWLSLAGPLMQPPLQASSSRKMESFSRLVSRFLMTSLILERSEKAILMTFFRSPSMPGSIPPSMG